MVNKIVELIINLEEFEFDDLGVEIMSLVDKPAIEVGWMAFAEDVKLRENADCPDGFEHEMPDGTWMCGKTMPSYGEFRENANCPDGFEHKMPDGNWMCGKTMGGYTAKFVDKIPGESEDAYIGRCIPVLKGEGYDDSQAAAICYDSFKCPDDKDCYDLDDACWPGYEAIGVKTLNGRTVPNCVPMENSEEVFQNAVLKLATELGTEIDPDKIIYVDGTKENFATVGDFLQGARAIAALGDLPASTPARLVYRYAGPPGQRFFCRALKTLNKIYSREEITRMNRLNLGFGPGGSNSYSIFEYKGGPNCQHYWEELVQFQDGSRNVLVSNGPATGDAGDTNNRRDPSPNGAVSNNAYLMSKHWAFSDDDQMIITGPAMIPNALIARKDEMGNLFHVYFSKDTVEKVARKFLADNNAHVTDINHDDNIVEENTLLESWIVEDPAMDKSKAMGFNVPKSTWMVSYKINNEDTWNKIKAGELNGFSVAGSFLEKIQSNG